MAASIMHNFHILYWLLYMLFFIGKKFGYLIKTKLTCFYIRPTNLGNQKTSLKFHMTSFALIYIRLPVVCLSMNLKSPNLIQTSASLLLHGASFPDCSNEKLRTENRQNLRFFGIIAETVKNFETSFRQKL